MQICWVRPRCKYLFFSCNLKLLSVTLKMVMAESNFQSCVMSQLVPQTYPERILFDSHSDYICADIKQISSRYYFINASAIKYFIRKHNYLPLFKFGSCDVNSRSHKVELYKNIKAQFIVDNYRLLTSLELIGETIDNIKRGFGNIYQVGFTVHINTGANAQLDNNYTLA